MNKGIKMASGDVIGVLNSDDFYHDERVVEDIANAFNQKDVECVYGNLVFIDENNKNETLRIWKGSQHECGAFLNGWHPAHPTFYVKSIWFERFGDFKLQYAVSADFELMLRFIEKGQIRNAYLDRYFVKMRMGGESTKSIHNIITGNKNILKAIKDNGFKPVRFYLIRRLIPKAWDMLKFKFETLLRK
jgi:glycosyltransferase involved in cell wall biosynthesis